MARLFSIGSSFSDDTGNLSPAAAFIRTEYLDWPPELSTAHSPYATDEAAVPDARRGHPAAQRFLYDRHSDAMMVVCTRYLPRREDAEEALMDAFVAFYKALPRFMVAGTGSVRAWLTKIVVNQCLMALRRERNRTAATLLEEDLPDEASTEADALAQISAREILALLQSLPEGYRTVFNLYAFEGWTHAEIAAQLGVSESTSKTQLFKARRAMQEVLRRTHIL